MKSRNYICLWLSVLIILLLPSCEPKDQTESSQTVSIEGNVQKGPFINGSSITVFDLKQDFSPSGKSYNSQITDDKGSFQLQNIGLSSSYVSLRADGFYFNEITGEKSTAQITLYGIADITGKTDINVNLLTHLEKSRVEFLIKNGKTFSEAKSQAQKEVLGIFNIEKTNIKASETLNISASGDDNGILLAITSILQGFRSESELTELLSNISNDMKEDGKLDDATLGSALVGQAAFLDSVAIKNNLAKRYSDIHSTASIPAFGKYIATFLAKSPYVPTQSMVTYPATGIGGNNVLASNILTLNSGYANVYSLTANLSAGASLKIRITAASADTIKVVHNDSIIINGKDSTIIPATKPWTSVTLIKPYFYYFFDTKINWTITDFNETLHTQEFVAIEPKKLCDLKVFFDKGKFLIEYYEMNSAQPTRQKIITVN